MKIAQVIDTLDVGGAEVLAVNIANSLSNKDVVSHLIVTRKEGELKKTISKNVQYTFLERKSTFDFSAIRSLKKYIKTHKITTVHAHSSSYFIVCLVKILYPKFKIVWHDHYGNSNFLSKRKRFPINKFSYLFNVVITVNTNLKEWGLKYLQVPSNKVVTVNNFASFNQEVPKTFLKGKQGKRIVCVAGFRPQKDHLNLLKAFKIVLQDHPNWTLHLIGKKYDDTYTNSIINFIENNSLKENVFLYGVCLDVKHILSQVTIGVLSSKSEGLPVTLLEYGLAKLPVLVTNVGDCNKVIKIEKALVASENSKAFATKLIEIISSKTLQNNIAFSLHEEVKRNYSNKSFVEKLINLYKI